MLLLSHDCLVLIYEGVIGRVSGSGRVMCNVAASMWLTFGAVITGADDAVVSEHHAYGGKGAVELAKAVKAACQKPTDFDFLYPLDQPIKAKIEVRWQPLDICTSAARLTICMRLEFWWLVCTCRGSPFDVCVHTPRDHALQSPSYRGHVAATIKACVSVLQCILVQAIAKSYGAASVTFSEEAEKKIELYTRSGFDKLPICMAKTQYRSASCSPG